MFKYTLSKSSMEFETDRLRMTTEDEISIVISPNGFGKSYLLDAIESAFEHEFVALNYNPEEIFNKYFNEYFMYGKAGDGYEAIIKICNKLASNKKFICLKNPEVYLHIEIQEVLIDVIEELFHGTGVKVFIETHSPHIINGNFDKIYEPERKEEK